MYILKAVKAGLVELTTTSARWIGGTQALLAYFCQRVYCENDNGTDNGQPFPESALNQFWGASRLGKARSQNANNKNTNGKPKGHQNIDNLFEYEAAN